MKREIQIKMQSKTIKNLLEKGPILSLLRDRLPVNDKWSLLAAVSAVSRLLSLAPEPTYDDIGTNDISRSPA